MSMFLCKEKQIRLQFLNACHGEVGARSGSITLVAKPVMICSRIDVRKGKDVYIPITSNVLNIYF